MTQRVVIDGQRVRVGSNRTRTGASNRDDVSGDKDLLDWPEQRLPVVPPATFQRSRA
jgi:hypothetical protein